MSQKTPKPTLTGQRIKTRKRDEKEKYDPTNFRDQIVAGLNNVNSDLEQASKFLIQAGSKLDFRRYAEALFDILITGGILGPGGTINDDNGATTSLCIFETEKDIKSMRNMTSVFERMIRQYKYLEKSLDDEMKKVLMFMKGFSDVQRERLAIAVYLLISSGLSSPVCLSQIVNEHLTKDGIGLDFARTLFSVWLSEKDFPSLISMLKKSEIDGKLLELFPLNKRTIENFEAYFSGANLNQIVEFQRNQNTRTSIQELKSRLKKLLENDGSAAEVIAVSKDCKEKHSLKDSEVCILLWTSLMNAVEWNKKEDLLAEQALRHLKKYSSVLQAFTPENEVELLLLQRIQEYCYDNMNFMKLFQKIIMLFYKTDVIGEDAIIRWYKDGHSAKGKSVFLSQMEKMVEWLQSAEEESSEDESDN
ncbi:eIF5-mimic protein 2 [Hydra vulgaris]|nr:eIF5-mimic protein 2 [Hydra vulgaris]